MPKLKRRCRRAVLPRRRFFSPPGVLVFRAGGLVGCVRHVGAEYVASGRDGLDFRRRFGNRDSAVVELLGRLQ
jgi:hypothetical protein